MSSVPGGSVCKGPGPGHVWAAGWRHSTIHPGRDALWEDLSPCSQGGSRATFRAGVQAWVTVSPSLQPRTRRQQYPPPQASQHDELSLGAPEDGVGLLLVEHLWKERVRGQRAAESGTPHGCAHQTLRCCACIVRGAWRGSQTAMLL